MIPARVKGDEVVAGAVLLDADLVDLKDPRLDYFFDELMQAFIADGREAAFLCWPDGSFGVAMLPLEEPERSQCICSTYGKARALLECLYLDHHFNSYDANLPH